MLTFVLVITFRSLILYLRLITRKSNTQTLRRTSTVCTKRSQRWRKSKLYSWGRPWGWKWQERLPLIPSAALHTSGTVAVFYKLLSLFVFPWFKILWIVINFRNSEIHGQLKTIAILALLKIQIVTDSDEGCLMPSSFNSFCISFSHSKSTGIDVLTLYHQFGPTRFTPQNHLDRFAFLLLSHLLSFSLDRLFSFHQNKLFQSSCTFLWS